MASGGYRLPSTPAVASGPGSLSKRTDGGPASKQAVRYFAGGDYGDGGLTAMQKLAPMAQTLGGISGSMPAGMPQPQQPQEQPVIPLTAPSQRPNEPVTSGAAAGAGPGPETLNTPANAQQQGLQDSLNLLQSLGDKVTPQVKNIRNALSAHMSNQANH